MVHAQRKLSFRTSVGVSDFSTITKEGSFGAALASLLNIGCEMEDTFKADPSTSLVFMELNYRMTSAK